MGRDRRELTLNAAFNLDEPFVADEVTDWRSGAPCGTVDADLFFDRAESCTFAEEQAKIICHGCPVADECLDAAMLGREEYGIWGGMTPQERKRYTSSWLRLKGGRGIVKTLRDSHGILAAAPHIDRKYQARFQAATRCRELLMNTLTFDRRDEYMMVLDLIIANPAEVADGLASRIGRSATWFNTMKREVYRQFGISEKANEL